MPKNKEFIKIPINQPDCCADCPLLGAIPENERRPRSQEVLVCLATWEAMSARFSRSRASTKDAKHPLHRPCDQKWERWQMAPFNGSYPVPYEAMNRYREKYKNEYMQFRIIFHDKRGRKPKGE